MPINHRRSTRFLDYLGLYLTIVGQLVTFLEDFAEVLKDGVILCRLMNKIVPGAIKKFKQKGPAFLLMENIQARSHLRLDFEFQEYFVFLTISGVEQMTILNP